MQTKIVPNIWFKDRAEEAMNYYCSIIPDSKIISIEYYPDESLDEHFKGMHGKVWEGIFEIAGQRFSCLDGGDPGFQLNPSFSLMVNCHDQAEIDFYWSKLSAVPEAEQCGWVQDQFGLSWQIIPENMGNLLKTPAQIQAMLQMKKIIIADLENAK